MSTPSCPPSEYLPTFKPGQNLVRVPVDAWCFKCDGLIPRGDEAVFVDGKGIRHKK